MAQIRVKVQIREFSLVSGGYAVGQAEGGEGWASCARNIIRISKPASPVAKITGNHECIIWVGKIGGKKFAKGGLGGCIGAADHYWH